MVSGLSKCIYKLWPKSYRLFTQYHYAQLRAQGKKGKNKQKKKNNKHKKKEKLNKNPHSQKEHMMNYLY